MSISSAARARSTVAGSHCVPLYDGMTPSRISGIANVALATAEAVVPYAREVAHKLAQRPLGAVMATKKLMRGGETILAQARAESKIFGERLRSAEAMEAFTAFQQKRAPDFSKL